MQTTYDKLVARRTIDGTTYYKHAQMIAADGSRYLTTDIADAHDYTGSAEAAPKGYRLRRVRRTVSRPCHGGGWIWESGPTGP